MTKGKSAKKDELRAEYKRSDLTGPMVRGKYAKEFTTKPQRSFDLFFVALCVLCDFVVNSFWLRLVRVVNYLRNLPQLLPSTSGILPSTSSMVMS